MAVRPAGNSWEPGNRNLLPPLVQPGVSQGREPWRNLNRFRGEMRGHVWGGRNVPKSYGAFVVEVRASNLGPSCDLRASSGRETPHRAGCGHTRQRSEFRSSATKQGRGYNSPRQAGCCWGGGGSVIRKWRWFVCEHQGVKRYDGMTGG